MKSCLPNFSRRFHVGKLIEDCALLAYHSGCTLPFGESLSVLTTFMPME